ncbi:MAG TPA: TonB-dependent siderophore receptor [Burkholderiaceae bacterium]|nr:TonB-dependent siderophore receptor [Burkholderiaceae bacterium]
MATPISKLSRLALAVSGALCAAAAAAQSEPGTAPATPVTVALPPVSVSGRTEPVADIAGFGDTPLQRTPIQASVITDTALRDAGDRNLRAATRTDASTSDAYNAVGYWDSLTVRGYVIDNRYNYQRDGLPINAETSIPLDNKSRIELLKGISGMQAGTSAPGGMVNLVVKRPETDVRSAFLEWRSAGSVLGAVDLGTRFGTDRAFGVRLNVAAEHLDPPLRNANGERNLFALAGDVRVSADTFIEAEVEHSHRSQPSQPAFSMLGEVVPDARSIDPRINMNNQPWSLPVVLDADNASVRLTQRLTADWSARVHAQTQQLKSDDRIAFPFGCSAEGRFDRYCSDGTYDLYDFRSDGEKRRTDAIDASVQGRTSTAGLEHQLTAGVLYTNFKARFGGQAFNRTRSLTGDPSGPPDGIGNIQGTLVVLPDPTLADLNTNRDERSTEFYARDALHITREIGAWFGVRHTHLDRSSVTPGGADPTSYQQSFTTPWVAISDEWREGQLVYASWGQGIESQVVPNRPDLYSNAGQPLPAQKSRQLEVGLKIKGERVDWGVAAFDIDRPVAAAVGDRFDNDGSDRHRGIEAAATLHEGAWRLSAGAMALRTQRRGSVDDSVNGKRAPNVAQRTLKMQGEYDVSALQGATLMAGLVAEGDREVDPANSARIPGWARMDLGAKLERRIDNRNFIWRVGVDNAFDRRAWQESPYQFGHIYLYPMAPRTWRASLQVDL